MEKYCGVKFDVVGECQCIPQTDMKKFLSIDKALGKLLTTQGNEGNLSIRTKDGFLIKRSGAQMTKLKKNDVVLVRRIAGKKVFCSGGIPSSESRMHYEIYKNAAGAWVVLHFHQDRMLGALKIKRIGPFSYGTAALAKAAGKAAKQHKIFEIKRHGFVVVGKDKDEMLRLLKTIL